MGFHIFAGNYAGTPAGFLTCFRSPMNIFVVHHAGTLAGFLTCFRSPMNICAGIHAGAGALAGFLTCLRSPMNMCTFFVPRSLSRISFMPLLAAFNAACPSDLPEKIPFSLRLASLRTKFLFSSGSDKVNVILGIMLYLRVYTYIFYGTIRFKI
jgi:hypothetical protein